MGYLDGPFRPARGTTPGLAARATATCRDHGRRLHYHQLSREIAETSFSAVGRRYGVSDNAVRKWIRQYEREQAGALVQDAATAAGT